MMSGKPSEKHHVPTIDLDGSCRAGTWGWASADIDVHQRIALTRVEHRILVFIVATAPLIQREAGISVSALCLNMEAQDPCKRGNHVTREFFELRWIHSSRFPNATAGSL